MTFVYEFLYRGPVNSEGRSSSFHVRLGEEVQAFGKTALQVSDPLSPDAAEKAGYSLATIVGEINTQALAECDSLRGECERLTEERDAAKAETKRAAEFHAVKIKEADDRIASEQVARRVAEAQSEKAATLYADLRAKLAAAGVDVSKLPTAQRG